MSSPTRAVAGHLALHAIRIVTVAASIASVSVVALAQSPGSDKTPMAVTSPTTAPSAAYHAVRASKVIGMDVQGANGKNVGKIKDLIINVNTGDVRYALLEIDPSFFKSDKLVAVPLSSLNYVADDKPLGYKEVTRAQLDKTAVDKADWQKALDNSRYVSTLDQNYGYEPPTGEARSLSASKLLGKNVDSRAGKGIGKIQDLVLDMGANKVDYAVLAFDPSWFSREKMFAFPLTAFTMTRGKDDLMLDVDRNTVQSMKNFDATHWEHLNDLDRDKFINRSAPKR